ncbi:MAG: c-type cytochrome [Acetobacteraceae bacterium]
MRRATVFSAALLCLCGTLSSCDDMTHQPRQKTYSPAPSPAPQPAGTVQFEVLPNVPPPVTMALLRRGQEQFRIYCTPCHSELGNGDGFVVQRGFPHPPSFMSADLLKARPQHFYDVITHGHGVMYSFAARVKPADRWAIAAYIHALQLSQHTTVAELTPAQRTLLK